MHPEEKDPARAGSDGASSDESGYRRDDYWRKAQEGLPADADPGPANGQDFETPAERVRSDDDTGTGTDTDTDTGTSGRTDGTSGHADDTSGHTPPHAK